MELSTNRTKVIYMAFLLVMALHPIVLHRMILLKTLLLKDMGGWQANGVQYPEYHWESCKLQTWSATAYISMVLNGIMGLRLNEQSLSFAPYLPAGIYNVSLTSLTYRNALLKIIIKGKGKK